MKMKNFTLTLALFIGLNLITVFATVLRNKDVVYEEPEPHTNVVTDKLAEMFKNNNFETDLTTENTNLIETTTCTEQTEKHETTIRFISDEGKENLKQHFQQIVMEGNNKKIETEIIPIETTTCSEKNHIHDETSERQRNDLEQNLSVENRESTTLEVTTEILPKKTTQYFSGDVTPIENTVISETTTDADTETSSINIQTEVTRFIKNGTKSETSTSPNSKYEYIKEKLKSNLQEKLKVKELLNRLRRQAQIVSSQQTEIQPNYSPVYRAPQSFNQAQYAQYQNMYRKATPYKPQKVVAQNVPGNNKAVKNPYPPPNSGNRYPVDSYLAYSNINNNYNLRYGTPNNGNRRQFQQNGLPRPTRRTTSRTTARQIKKKFRPMPVFV